MRCFSFGLLILFMSTLSCKERGDTALASTDEERMQLLTLAMDQYESRLLALQDAHSIAIAYCDTEWAADALGQPVVTAAEKTGVAVYFSNHESLKIFARHSQVLGSELKVFDQSSGTSLGSAFVCGKYAEPGAITPSVSGGN